MTKWTTGGEEPTKVKKAPSWAQPEIQKLLAQNNKADSQLQWTTSSKKPPKQKNNSPTIISRVFEALSRGQYASAEANRRVVASDRSKHKGFLDKFNIPGTPYSVGNLDDLATGAVAGLTGKKKTSYSNVIAEAGIKNKAVQAVGGLFADIALDPSTYVGGAAVKGLSETEKAARLTDATAKALETAQKAGTIKSAGQKARLLHAAEGLKTGAKVTAKDLTKVEKTAARTVRDSIIKTAQDSERAKQASQGTKIGFHVGKAEVVSQKPVDAIKSLVNQSRKLPGIDAALTGVESHVAPVAHDLRGLFQSAATYGPLNESRKLLRARSVANYDDIVSRYGLDAINLTKDESTAFSHAYEKGTSSLLGTSKHGVDYADLTDRVKNLNHELFTEEQHAGLIPAKTKELDNYLYHVYGNEAKSSAFKTARKKAIASDAFKPSVERKIPTLADAASKGLNPETNITAILKERAAKSTQSLARRDFVAEAADKFGSELDPKLAGALKKQGHEVVNLKSKLKNVKAGASLDYLKDNIYVPKEIGDVLGNVEDKFATPDKLKHIVGLMDNVQNKWKSAVTVYSPGHHVRNLISDVFLSALDGVTNPAVYDKALKLTVSKDLSGVTKIGNHELSNDLLMKLFHESGASPSFIQTENLGKHLGNKVTAKLHDFAEKRESFGRLAHFIDSFGKEAKGVSHGGVITPELLDAAKKAGSRVRKWHLDYGDLTPFEKNVMKRAAPFYTWLRKSTPLMVEAAATRPGRVATVPKSLSAIEKLMGGPGNPALPKELIPKWIRQMGGIQAFTSKDGNPTFLAPTLPTGDLPQMLEGGTSGIISNLLSQTSPLIRAPIELGTKKQLFTGAPTPKLSDYLLQQLPISRVGGAVVANQGDPDKNDTVTRILNFLTGAGLYEATPNRIRGEIRRQMDPKQAQLKKARAKILKGLNG